MKLKVLKSLKDKETKKKYVKGDVLDLPDDRAEDAIKRKLVKKMEAPKNKKKKAPKNKSK